MRPSALFLVAAGCATSPDAPESTATFSAAPAAIHARAQAGVAVYGAPYHKWTITFSAIEGCTGDPLASIEINTLSSVLDLPVGSIPLRAALATIETLPSAFLTYQDAALVSGTIQVSSATPTFASGSVSAMVTLAGAATTITGTFSTPVCN